MIIFESSESGTYGTDRRRGALTRCGPGVCAAVNTGAVQLLQHQFKMV
jgi:hypothetical protein